MVKNFDLRRTLLKPDKKGCIYIFLYLLSLYDLECSDSCKFGYRSIEIINNALSFVNPECYDVEPQIRLAVVKCTYQAEEDNDIRCISLSINHRHHLTEEGKAILAILSDHYIRHNFKSPVFDPALFSAHGKGIFLCKNIVNKYPQYNFIAFRDVVKEFSDLDPKDSVFQALDAINS